MSVFPQFHSFMSRLFIPVSLPVHCYHLQKLMYSDGGHLQNFDVFPVPSPLLTPLIYLTLTPTLNCGLYCPILQMKTLIRHHHATFDNF